MRKLLLYLLKKKWILGFLIAANALGTLYGFYWYRYQLAVTPEAFLIFVPDSPTASLFFLVFLLAFTMGKSVPYIEALAMVTLFKYGIWAVVMNICGGYVSGGLTFINYMLIFSHLAMAIEGLLFTRFYTFGLRHWFVCAIWTLHNDVIDYLFQMMPRYPVLSGYETWIGYGTFWLSILSLALAYVFVVQKRHRLHSK